MCIRDRDVSLKLAELDEHDDKQISGEATGATLLEGIQVPVSYTHLTPDGCDLFMLPGDYAIDRLIDGSRGPGLSLIHI